MRGREADMQKEEKKERRGRGNESSVSVSPRGWCNLESLRLCRQKTVRSKIHHYWDKVTCWFWKRTEGPFKKKQQKTVSRCCLHILSFFFIFNVFFFFFFSSIIQSTSLIDMTAACVISVPDIWSVLALGIRGLLRVLFFPFHDGRCFRSAAANLIILSQRGILRRAFVACFSLYYLTFLRYRLTYSKVRPSVWCLCAACMGEKNKIKKADLWLHKVLFKSHCSMMYHTRSSINKGSLKNVTAL